MFVFAKICSEILNRAKRSETSVTKVEYILQTRSVLGQRCDPGSEVGGASVKTLEGMGLPPKLSGFICAFHPVAPGLIPKHTIYAIVIYIQNVLYLSCEKNKKGGWV